MEVQSNGTEGICVGVRMRPLNQREIRDNLVKAYKCQNGNNAVYQCTRDGQMVDNQAYYYDKVFDEDSTTEDVYKHVGKKIVAGVVSGINGTIFAYGQTSSGKTHTMLGGEEYQGLLEMSVVDIFDQLSQCTDRKFAMRVSFLEIYNEVIRDLLSEDRKEVKIREDPLKGVFVECTEVIITEFESIMKNVRKGLSKRAVESTNMNEASSRSHTIFKLVLESQATDGTKWVSNLNLVDLAGSESVKHTGNEGQKAKEGGKINQSLLSLSRVISALAEHKPNVHVGYRDSKLTRILQPSLAGNAKMSIICCITSADRYMDETRSTLQFASRAKLVTTSARVNEVVDDSVMVKRLTRELDEQKEKYHLLEGSMLSLNKGDEKYAELTRIIEERNKEIQIKDDRLNKLNEKLLLGSTNIHFAASTSGAASTADGAASSSSSFMENALDFDTDVFSSTGAAGGINGMDFLGSSSKKRNRARETWCPRSINAPNSAKSRTSQPESRNVDDVIQAYHTYAFNKMVQRESSASSVQSGSGSGRSSSGFGSDNRSSLSSDCSTVPDADMDTSSAECGSLAEELANKDQLIRDLQGRLFALENGDATAAIETASEGKDFEVEAAALREQLRVAEERLQAQETSIESLHAQLQAHVDSAAAKESEWTAELASARKTIAELHTELETMSASASVNTLSVERESELMEEKASIASSLAQSQSEVAELREQLESLQTKMETESASFSDTIRFLEEKTTALEAELDEACTQCEASQLDLESAAEETAALKQTLEECEAKLNEALSEAQAQEEVSVQLAAMRADLAASRSEVAQLQEAIGARDAQIAALMAEGTALQVSFDNAVEQHTASQSALEARLSEAVSAASAGDSELHATLLAKETELCTAREALTSLESQLVEAQSASTAEIEGLRESLSDAQASIKATEMTLEETQSELSSARETVEDLQAHAIEAETKVEELELAVAESEEKLQQSEEAMTTLRSDQVVSQENLTTLQSQLDVVAQELQTATEQCEAYKQATVEAESKLAAAEVTVSELQSEVSAAQETVSELQSEQSVLAEEMQALTEEADALRQIVTELEGKIHGAESTVESLQSELAQSTTAVSALETQLAQREGDASEVVTSLQITVTEQAETVATLTTQVATVTAERDNALLELEQNAEADLAASESMEALETKVSEYEGEIASLQTKAAEYEGEVASLQTKTTEYEGEIASLQIKTAEYEGEIASLRAAESSAVVDASTTEALQAQLTQASAAIESLTEEKIALEAQVALLQSESEECRAQIRSLEEAVSDATEAETMNGERVFTLETKLDSVIEQLNTEKGRVLKLLSEVAAAEEARDTAVATLQQKEVSFESELHEMKTTVAELTNELTEKESEVDQLTQTLQIAEQKLSTLAAAAASMSAHKPSVGSLNETEVTQGALDGARRDMERAVESMRCELGQKEGEVSRLRASVTEWQERAQRAEHNLSQVNERDNHSAGGDEAMRKKVSQLQTTVDLLRSEKDSVCQKLAVFESESRAKNGHDAVYAEQLERKLSEQTKGLERLQAESANMSRLVETVQALEKRLAETRADRDETKQYANHAAERISELESTLETQCAEIRRLSACEDSDMLTALQADLAAAVERESTLQATIDRMEGDIRESSSRLKKTKENSDMMLMELQSNEQTIAALTAEKERLTTELADCVQEVADLTTALEEAEGLTLGTASSAVDRSAELAELTNKLAATTDELSEARTQIEQAENTLMALNASLVEAQTECAALGEQVAALTADLSEAQELASSFEIECTELSAASEKMVTQHGEDIARLHTELTEVKEALAAAESAAAEKEATAGAVAALQEQVAALESTLSTKAEELATLQTQLANSVEQLALSRDIQSQMSAVEADLQAEIDSLRNEVTSAHTAAAAAAAVDTDNDSKSIIESLKNEVTELRVVVAETEDLRSDLSQLRTVMVEQEEILAETESELQRTKQSLGAKVIALEEAVERSAEEVRVLRERLAEMTADKAEVECELRVKDEELQSVSDQLSVTEETIRTLNETIVMRDARILKLDAAKLTKEQVEKISAQKAELKTLKGDHKLLKKQLERLQAVYVETKAQLAEAIQNNNSNNASGSNGGPSPEYVVSDLKFQIAELGERVAKEESMKGQLLEKLKECSKQLAEYEHERNAVIDVLDQHGVDTTGLVALDTSLASEDVSHSSSVAQAELSDAVAALAKKMVTAQASATAKEANKSTKVTELEAKLKSTAAECDDLRAQKMALEKRLEAMKAAARDGRAEVATLTVEIETLQSQIVALKAQLSEADNRVLTSGDSSSSQIQVLEEENIELLAENKAMQIELRRLRSTVPASAASVVSSAAGVNTPSTAAATKTSTESAVVGQKRAFGTELTTQTVLNRENVSTPGGNNNQSGTNKRVALSAADGSSAKTPSLSALVTGAAADSAVVAEKVATAGKTTRTRVAAKPVVEEQECTQS